MAGYVWTNPKNEQINNIAELPFLTGYDTNNCLVVSIPQPPTKPRFCFSWMGFARNLFDKSTSCFIVFPLVLQPPQTRPITQMKPTRIEQQMRIKEGKYLGRQQAIPRIPDTKNGGIVCGNLFQWAIVVTRSARSEYCGCVLHIRSWKMHHPPPR